MPSSSNTDALALYARGKQIIEETHRGSPPMEANEDLSALGSVVHLIYTIDAKMPIQVGLLKCALQAAYMLGGRAGMAMAVNAKRLEEMYGGPGDTQVS